MIGLTKALRRIRLNKKGFSLLEVLVAVAILVIITVPLAMNMISSSQMNSKAKQTGASSDLAKSIMETLQTVDLSDIMTDVNGYVNDEYGERLDYFLTNDSLSGYEIGQKSEVIIPAGKANYFKQVVTQEIAGQDKLVESSIHTRLTGETVRAYFTGQENKTYMFLLNSVETKDMDVDVLVKIKAEKQVDIINIVSMQQSEVLYAKQLETMDETVAAEFKKANDMYIALKGTVETITNQPQSYFFENMKRELIVTMEKDSTTEAVTVSVQAKYTMETNDLRERDKTIVKNIGSFSTNSTSEYARGIYVYYTRMMDNEHNGEARDIVTINNPNEIAVPVFLIATTRAGDEGKVYSPILNVNELSDEYYTEKARTTVCSNINQAAWREINLTPLGTRQLTVKDLGNASDQQTFYSVEIQVYDHRENSYSAENYNGNSMMVFEPREKDLIVELTGSFIDTSEVLDLDSDATINPQPPAGKATVSHQNWEFDGNEKIGVYGYGVNISGQYKETNAGTYTAYVKPMSGYVWADDGTTVTRTLTWKIERAPTATVTTHTFTYDGVTEFDGVDGTYITVSGVEKAKDAGYYTAYATPDANHAWPDGTYQTKSVKWRVSPKTIEIKWAEGQNLDTWVYDGVTHSGSFDLIGIVSGDTCTATVIGNEIKDVGTKTATITGLSNSNYTLPTTNTTHMLSVTSAAGAFYLPVPSDQLIYNGTVKNYIATFDGVVFAGNTTGKDAGEYTFTATPKSGLVWGHEMGEEYVGTTTPISVTWNIEPIVAVLTWSSPQEWDYDGLYHTVTCQITNLVSGDENVQVILSENNSIKNAGSETVVAEGITSPNYILPSTNTSCVITIRPLPLATYTRQDFSYDGAEHFGVSGQYIDIIGDYKGTDVVVNDDGTVGTYKVIVKPKLNYTWDNGTTETVELEWKITPIIDAWNRAYSFVYSGNLIQNTQGDNVIFENVYEATTIGKYTMTVIPEKNHAWKDTGTMERRQFEWEITSANFAKPILNSTTFVYDGQEHAPVIDATTASSGYKVTGTLNATNAGVYTITVSLLDPDHSTWSDGTNAPIEYTWMITQREVTVAFDSNTFTYNNVAYTGTAQIGNVISGDNVGFTYSGTRTATNAGTYPFSVSGLTGADAGNYKLPSSGLNGSLVINKRTIGITWGQTSFTYDGYQKTVTASATNLATGTTCTLTLTGNTETNAGTYNARVTGLNNANYQLPADVSKSWTINKAKAAEAYAISGLIFNANTQTGVGGKYFTLVSGSTTGKNAGTYTAYVKPSDNYEWTSGGTEQKTITWSIAQANGSVTTKPTAKSLTYNGNSQTLINAGSGTGTMYYRVNGGSWSTSLPSAKEAGNYAVEYYAASSTNYTQSATGSLEVIIKQANGSCTAPTAKSLTYNGSAQTLINVGSSNTGTMYYKLGMDGSWSTSAPKATNAGTYNVYYYSDGGNNYTSTDKSAYVTVTIAQAKGYVSTAPTAKSLTYTGSAQYLINAGSGTGTMYYSTTSASSGFSTSLPTGTNAGTYTVWYYSAASSDGNYTQSSTGSLNVTITQRTGSCTAPTAKSLTYNGSDQTLINAGSSSTGTMYYKLGANGAWSTSLPTATAAGTYYVYYYSEGGTNSTDTSQSVYVTVSIAKATGKVTTAPTGKGLSYTGSAQQLINAGASNSGVMEYKVGSNGTWSTSIPTGTNAGSYDIYYRAGETTNYTASAGNVYVTSTIKQTNYVVGDKIYVRAGCSSYFVPKGAWQNDVTIGYENPNWDLSWNTNFHDVYTGTISSIWYNTGTWPYTTVDSCAIDADSSMYCVCVDSLDCVSCSNHLGTSYLRIDNIYK